MAAKTQRIKRNMLQGHVLVRHQAEKAAVDMPPGCCTEQGAHLRTNMTSNTGMLLSLPALDRGACINGVHAGGEGDKGEEEKRKKRTQVEAPMVATERWHIPA